MSEEVKAGIPKAELAAKDWMMKGFMDTDHRIEMAFHEQTQFLSQKNEDLKRGVSLQTRWMVGLVTTMTIAIIILAVLFKN